MDTLKYKKIIVPSLIATVAIGFGINAFRSNEETNDLSISKRSPVSESEKVITSTKPENPSLVSSKNKNKFIETVEERLQLISSTRDLSPYDNESISSAINDPRVWDFSTQASPDDLPLDETEKQDGRAFFNANPARVAVSIPGDVLEIALPNVGEPLLLDVKQAGVLENGIVKLSGSIQGEDGTFNMSQGDNITAGHINTSTDTYSFEVFGDTGWIHQSGALFTGEHPPVVDNSGAVVNSTLGNQGEQIFAKGNNEIEGAVHNHSHGQLSNSNEAYINASIEEE